MSTFEYQLPVKHFIMTKALRSGSKGSIDYQCGPLSLHCCRILLKSTQSAYNFGRRII